MRKPGSLRGSVSSLYNGSHSRHAKVSIVSLENRELREFASECFPNISITVWLSVCLPTCICLFISVTPVPFTCHRPTLPIVLFMSCVSASCSLSPPDSSSAFLPFSHCLSTLPDPNMSVPFNKCPEVPYEVTLPGSVSSPSESQLAWDHSNGFENCFKIKRLQKYRLW